jgi:antitoxin component YwqK of YwqJK toxin-antitoxin module
MLHSFIFSHSQNNANGYNVFYYPGGKVSSEGNMKDGKPEGYWKTYYENGILKSEGNRNNFELDSIWKFYNDKGILTLEVNYENGKKSGYTNKYSDEGILESKDYFMNDVKDSVSFFYYPNGLVSKTIVFENGKEHGKAFEYATDGRIITLMEYKTAYLLKKRKINKLDNKNMKQGEWIEFYEDGSIKSEGNYLNDLKNGYFREYSMNGELIRALKYVNGELVQNAEELPKLEIKTEFYDNAKIKSAGSYKNGIQEGVFREYDTIGEITASKIYVNGHIVSEGIVDEAGLRQGPWIDKYESGEIKSKGKYKNGKRVGEWNFYHKNGKTEQEGKYNDAGKPHGLWKWYYESGNLLREEEYDAGKENGWMKELSDSGFIITEGEYIDGLKEGKWIYQIADHKEIGNYKSDSKDSIWIHYYIKSGNKSYEGNYIEGNPDGKHKYYYENGKIKEEQNYAMGKRDGSWRKYNEDGLVFIEILYKNDIEKKYDGVKLKPDLSTIDQQEQ